MKPCNFDPSKIMIFSAVVMALSDEGAFKIVVFFGPHVSDFLISSAFASNCLHLPRSLVLSCSLLASLTAFMYNSVARIALSKASAWVGDLSMPDSAACYSLALCISKQNEYLTTAFASIFGLYSPCNDECKLIDRASTGDGQPETARLTSGHGASKEVGKAQAKSS